MGGFNGGTYASDRFFNQTAARGAPVLDNTLGGKDDLSLVNASESGGVTTLSFARPLNTGSPGDYDLSTGEYKFYGTTDNVEERHAIRSARGVFSAASNFTAIKVLPAADNRAIPKLNEWGLILSGLLLLAFAYAVSFVADKNSFKMR